MNDAHSYQLFCYGSQFSLLIIGVINVFNVGCLSDLTVYFHSSQSNHTMILFVCLLFATLGIYDPNFWRSYRWLGDKIYKGI